MKTVALGSDPNAAELKEIVRAHLVELGYECRDYGSDDPIYANVAFEVAEAVVAGHHDRGILFCGTGIGMCIAANKVPGASAALCSDPYSAERAVKSNNAKIMTLGSQVMGPELAKSLAVIWLESEYAPGGRSEPKILRIEEYEGRICGGAALNARADLPFVPGGDESTDEASSTSAPSRPSLSQRHS